jgi:hypothetical protein
VQNVYVYAGKVFETLGNYPIVVSQIGGSGFFRFASPITGLISLAAHDGKIYALVKTTEHRVQRYTYTGTLIDEVIDSAGAFDVTALGAVDYDKWIRVDSDGQCWAFLARRGRLFKITSAFEEVSTAANVQTYSYLNDQINGVFDCEQDFVGFGYEQTGASHPFTISYTFRRFKIPTAIQPTIQTVVERLCSRAGLASTQYDASGLAAIARPVRSMAISQTTPVRQVLETLASVYFFGNATSDKLYFRPRGGSSVATIPYAALGAGEGEGQDEPLQLKLRNELEVPAQIALTYSNVDGDFNVATEYSDRLLSGQSSTSAVQGNYTLLP